MSNPQIALDGLRPFYNQLIADGYPKTFDEFLTDVNALSPDFAGIFAEDIDIYNSGFHFSNIDDIMTELAKQYNGKMPSRKGLQTLMQALQANVTIDPTDILDVARVELQVIKDTGQDVYEGGAAIVSAAKDTAQSLLTVLPYVPYIAIGLVAVYVFMKAKK